MWGFFSSIFEEMFIEVPQFHKSSPALKNFWLPTCQRTLNQFNKRKALTDFKVYFLTLAQEKYRNFSNPSRNEQLAKLRAKQKFQETFKAQFRKNRGTENPV